MAIINAIGNVQLDKANNLSDVPNKPLAMGNLSQGFIDATTRQLKDLTAVLSIDWETRILYNTAGSQMINFSNATDITFASKNLSTISFVSANSFRTVEGVNGNQGAATLVAGTVTVANTNITANSRIFLSCADLNTTGQIYYTLNPGVGFSITSHINTDNGVIAYLITEPG